MSSSISTIRTSRDSSRSNGRKPAKKRYNGMSDLQDYIVLEQLGQGTFGIVSKARQKSSNKLVALKKLIIHDTKDGFPITAFREISIMKKLKHLNVLQLIDMIHQESDDTKKPGFFYTVTPYISSDLNGLLNNPRVELTVPQIKCIMEQLLQGINYIHNEGYLHRDIKTANILLDYFGIVKIADFGLARVYHGPPPSEPESLPGGGKVEYTGLVVTRWYRPPELLLGERKYTTAVDMWGIGCVLGELFTKKPILEGQSDLDQADMIFKLLGAPTDENFPNYQVINRNGVNLTVNYSRSLEKQYSPILPSTGVKLLAGLLTLDPRKRFNALMALASDFFKSPPLPCSPEKLPKFEESHESDIKKFKEEKRKGLSAVPLTGQKSSYNSLNHSKYGINNISLNDRDETPYREGGYHSYNGSNHGSTQKHDNIRSRPPPPPPSGAHYPPSQFSASSGNQYYSPPPPQTQGYNQPKASWTAAHGGNRRPPQQYATQWHSPSTNRPFKIQNDSRYPEFGVSGGSHSGGHGGQRFNSPGILEGNKFKSRGDGYSFSQPAQGSASYGGDYPPNRLQSRQPSRTLQKSVRSLLEDDKQKTADDIPSTNKLYEQSENSYSVMKQVLHGNKKRDSTDPAPNSHDSKKVKK